MSTIAMKRMKITNNTYIHTTGLSSINFINIIYLFQKKHKALATNSLNELFPTLIPYDVIGIDEGHYVSYFLFQPFNCYLVF